MPVLRSMMAALTACAPVAVMAASCGGRSGIDDVAPSCLPPNDTSGPSLAPDSLTNHCGRGPAPGVCPAPGDAAYRQDGNYRIRVPTYTVHGSTVSDSVTGLTWQRTPSVSMTYDGAAAYCDALTLDGAGGFRLPTRLELVTLLDYGTEGPAMSPVFDQGTPAGAIAARPDYWSTSVHGAMGADGSTVCGDTGGVAGPLDGSTAYVRCVTGADPPSGYQVLGDTTLDAKTGLEWARDVSDPLTWEDALAYCAALRCAGAAPATGGCPA